jgi:LPXTG-motif cell wall-anchored protein
MSWSSGAQLELFKAQLGRQADLDPTLSGHSMRTTIYVAGALCCLMGGVWFLQGVNVLPGSFMTGQTKWAVYGGLLLLVGIALLVAGKRRQV